MGLVLTERLTIVLRTPGGLQGGGREPEEVTLSPSGRVGVGWRRCWWRRKFGIYFEAGATGIC